MILPETVEEYGGLFLIGTIVLRIFLTPYSFWSLLSRGVGTPLDSQVSTRKRRREKRRPKTTSYKSRRRVLVVFRIPVYIWRNVFLSHTLFSLLLLLLFPFYEECVCVLISLLDPKLFS